MTATTSRAAVAPAGREAARRAGASALYEGVVRHRRFGSPSHEFSSPIVMTLLDVDELERLDDLPLWSRRRRAPMQFRRSDYLDGSDTPLRLALGDVVEREIGRRPTGPIRMLTHLRTWGWVFNPITVYWCFTDGPDPRPDVVVLEVTNTPWKERHWYVIEAELVTGRGRVFPKALHVSPFLDMDLDYRFSFTAPSREPGSPLSVRLELLRDGRKVFDADLWLTRTELTTGQALAAVFRRPFETMRVSLAIYRQAARLTAKGVAFVAHPDRHHTERTRP